MKIKLYTIALFCILISESCSDDFFAIKSDKSLVIPTTIADLQAMVDRTGFYEFYPNLGIIGCDDYYLFPDVWNSLTGIPHNAYIWANDPFEGANVNDWNQRFVSIFTANTVLEELESVPQSENNIGDWNRVRGQGLFHRANSFFVLSQIFAAPFDEKTAATDLGIPIRLRSDIEVNVQRSSVQDTYDQILKDLSEALQLLPSNELPNNNVGKFRPSKCTVYALLSRIHLSMRSYELAGKYADSCLTLYNALMDFNVLNSTSSYPIPRLNEEVILHYTFSNNSTVSPVTRNRVDTTLYALYEDDDLRKSLYFQQQTIGHTLRASYNGSLTYFGGITTSEIYLNRAECRARIGNTSGAMDDINTLLFKRYRAGTYLPKSATSASEALNIVLEERRKELITRGLRWSDLRRLNKEPEHEVIITRILGSETYQLIPNSSRYIWPIPDYEIEMSGIEQNER